METVSEDFRRKFAKAERSGIPSDNTRMTINLLNALDIPIGITVSDVLSNFFIAKAQERGLTIPASELSKVEQRSFTAKVKKVCPDFDVRIDESVRKQILAKGVTVRKSAPQPVDDRYKYWTPEMMEQMNWLHQQIAEEEAERADPLLKVARIRGTVPTRRKK